MLELTTLLFLTFVVKLLKPFRFHTTELLMSSVVTSVFHPHSSTTEDSKKPLPLPLLLLKPPTLPTLPSKLNGSLNFSFNQIQELLPSSLLTPPLPLLMPVFSLLSIPLLAKISVHQLLLLPPLLKLPLLGMSSQLVLPLLKLLLCLVP